MGRLHVYQIGQTNFVGIAGFFRLGFIIRRVRCRARMLQVFRSGAFVRTNLSHGYRETLMLV